MNVDPTTKKNSEMWLSGQYDEETKNIIKSMTTEQLVNAFHTNLAFGTGGLRGVMGVGTNRINRYTIQATTQGLANYILTQPKPSNGYSVIIGYDSRHHSKEFAECSAKVLAGNGIQVYLFKSLRPTPLVSFACRLKKCTSAIMITASHNPPQYNGYKVYWNSGGQVLPPHDKGIIQAVHNISNPSMVKSVNSISDPLIELIDDEIDTAYYDTIETLQNYPKENHLNGHALKIIYSNLHGTGITLIPETLKRWGFTNLSYVKSQMEPNGDFPTVKTPNPEEREALSLGIQELEKHEADILIATDPDADRMAVAFRHKGETKLLNGNQIASLCLYHVCQALTNQNRMPKSAAFVKTIATTELFKAIAQSFGKPCFDVLPGFKYIAELIHKWEQNPNGHQFIFGGEESYGYLLGTQSHDKDGILSSALICEVALHAKNQGKILLDLLYDLYNKYGVYIEELHSVKFKEGKAGKDQIKKGIETIEKNPPKTIGGLNVITLKDYKKSLKTDFITGQTIPLTLPKSSAYIFCLEDGSKLLIRPSGTEPKIKIYCSVVQKEFSSIPEALTNCHKRADRLISNIVKILNH